MKKGQQTRPLLGARQVVWQVPGQRWSFGAQCGHPQEEGTRWLSAGSRAGWRMTRQMVTRVGDRGRACWLSRRARLRPSSGQTFSWRAWTCQGRKRRGGQGARLPALASLVPRSPESRNLCLLSLRLAGSGPPPCPAPPPPPRRPSFLCESLTRGGAPSTGGLAVPKPGAACPRRGGPPWLSGGSESRGFTHSVRSDGPQTRIHVLKTAPLPLQAGRTVWSPPGGG